MNSLQAMAWVGSKKLRKYSHGFAKGSHMPVSILGKIKMFIHCLHRSSCVAHEAN